MLLVPQNQRDTGVTKRDSQCNGVLCSFVARAEFEIAAEFADDGCGKLPMHARPRESYSFAALLRDGVKS